MNKVIDTERIPIKLWLDDIEIGALEQAKNLANLPFTYKWVSIMPDAHQGYGMPIGGVIATEGVVIPNAVGKDIGCGMCAVKTSLKAEQLNNEVIKKIFGGSKEYHGGIRSCVPVGFEHQSKRQDESLLPPLWDDELKIVTQQYESALKQIGTLGGGNHFIEIQKDTDKNIWIMIHSGSRNLGLKVADYYNDTAVELNERWFSSVPKKWELSFLPIESQEAKDYMAEMKYCVDFALANRKLMMERIFQCFSVIPGGFEIEPMINIAHNYCIWENHYGKNVIIHRKGATLAREGTIGIIPGSQGTKSYIVKGLGNRESFDSCSHGAGRRMGRKQAKRELNLDDEKRKLDEQGIIHAVRNANDLDETPGAYKSIDKVMSNQSDLVEILVELSPLAVIKT